MSIEEYMSPDEETYSAYDEMDPEWWFYVVWQRARDPKTLYLMIEADLAEYRVCPLADIMETMGCVSDRMEQIEAGLMAGEIDPVLPYHHLSPREDWQPDVDDFGAAVGRCPRCEGEARLRGDDVGYLVCLSCGHRSGRVT